MSYLALVVLVADLDLVGKRKDSVRMDTDNRVAVDEEFSIH